MQKDEWDPNLSPRCIKCKCWSNRKLSKNLILSLKSADMNQNQICCVGSFYFYSHFQEQDHILSCVIFHKRHVDEGIK